MPWLCRENTFPFGKCSEVILNTKLSVSLEGLFWHARCKLRTISFVLSGGFGESRNWGNEWRWNSLDKAVTPHPPSGSRLCAWHGCVWV